MGASTARFLETPYAIFTTTRSYFPKVEMQFNFPEITIIFPDDKVSNLSLVCGLDRVPFEQELQRVQQIVKRNDAFPKFSVVPSLEFRRFCTSTHLSQWIQSARSLAVGAAPFGPATSSSLR